MMTPYLRYRLGTIGKRAHALQTRIRSVGKIWAPFLHGGLPLPVLHSISIHTRHTSCASINDAQLLAAAGFQSFIITRPVVDSSALEMLASLTAHYEFTVVVDHFRQAELLSHALIARGSGVHVLLDVDLGRQTTGVRPGPDSVNLATAVSQLPRVRLQGIFMDDRCTGTPWESPTPALSFAESLAVARHCQRMIQSGSRDCEPIITAFDCSEEALNAAEIDVMMTSPMQSAEFPNPAVTDVAVELVCRVLSRPSLEWCVVNAPRSAALTWTSRTATEPNGATLLHARGDVATFAISGESRDLRIGDQLSISAEAFVATERHNLPFATED